MHVYTSYCPHLGSELEHVMLFVYECPMDANGVYLDVLCACLPCCIRYVREPLTFRIHVMLPLDSCCCQLGVTLTCRTIVFPQPPQ